MRDRLRTMQGRDDRGRASGRGWEQGEDARYEFRFTSDGSQREDGEEDDGVGGRIGVGGCGQRRWKEARLTTCPVTGDWPGRGRALQSLQ